METKFGVSISNLALHKSESQGQRAPRQILKVVHLSTYDISGGAARAAYRLHSGLRQLGHDSSMLVADRKSNDPNVRVFVPPRRLTSRVRRRLRSEWITRSFSRYRPTRPEGYEKFSDDRTVNGT